LVFPQAPYNPASLIGLFPVSRIESLIKRMSVLIIRGSPRKALEHLDQISSSHMWNSEKNKILIGVIVLMQEWTSLRG
jgi:hypothetical protein